MLLDNGSDPEQSNKWGVTPLMLVCRGYIPPLSSEEITEDIEANFHFILKRTSDVNRQNQRGETAMHYVKYAEFFGPLIMHGANIDAQDHRGQTPLHSNAKEDSELLKGFLEHHPNVDARDNNGDTALHCVSFNREMSYLPENARLLLAAGANPNIRNRKGLTPVHVATTTLFWEVLRILIVAGADVNIRDNEGRTALGMIEDGIIQQYGEPELVYCSEDYPDEWVPGKEDIADLLRLAGGHT